MRANAGAARASLYCRMTENSLLDLARATCARYGLPALKSAHFVEGGLTHRLARLECEGADFALKILSRRALREPMGAARFERAETLARRAQQAGVPTVCARQHDGRWVQAINGECTLLYPWREGRVLPPTPADVAVCAQMGAILARLHAARVRFAGQSAPLPEAFESGHFARLLERGRENNAAWAEQVERDLARLESINARALTAQNGLCEGWVTGHLDFDQKNVLWHQGAPTVIDWENAKPIHPALEAMGAGLSWAGQSVGQTNRESLRAFFEGYARHNELAPADIERASEGVLGKWLIWLEFNLQRSLEPTIAGTPEAQVCHDALFHALHTTLQLGEDAPRYRAWVRGASE